MVEVDSNSKSLKGEPGEAPQAFEKGGKPLYRLNLGTNETWSQSMLVYF